MQLADSYQLASVTKREPREHYQCSWLALSPSCPGKTASSPAAAAWSKRLPDFFELWAFVECGVGKRPRRASRHIEQASYSVVFSHVRGSSRESWQNSSGGGWNGPQAVVWQMWANTFVCLLDITLYIIRLWESLTENINPEIFIEGYTLRLCTVPVRLEVCVCVCAA